MKKTLSVALVASLSGALFPEAASACGDKFLVIGRTTPRVQVAKHPGVVLLAVRTEDTKLASAMRTMKLGATLAKAGHTVETLSAPSSLPRVLAARKYDFIVTGVDTAAAMAKESASLPAGPEVISVSLDAGRGGKEAAAKEDALVIHAPSKSLGYLAAMDAAMARRQKP